MTYSFKLTGNNNKLPGNNSGEAILGSLFFLAAEVDEDSETGDAYGCSEHWDKSSNCSFSIRIGIGKDAHGKLRATVHYNCSEKNGMATGLSECPTLRAGSRAALPGATDNGLAFINAYVNNCKKMNQAVDMLKFVKSDTLATTAFKDALAAYMKAAYKKDPGLGPGADPVLDAQDWPDEGFEPAV